MKQNYFTLLLFLFGFMANSQPILNFKNTFGGTGIDEITFTTYNNQGSIFVLGLFSDTVDFDPSATGTFKLGAAIGQKDLFIASYSNTGAFVWAVQIKSTVEIIPKEIHIDNWGSIVYCGSYKGTVDFDPSASASVNRTSKGGYDAFIARIKANGTYDNTNGYATSLGGTSDDMATGFSMVNNNQQIFFAGTFRGTVVINGFQGATDTLVAGNGKGIFIQKINGNGGTPQYTGSIIGTNAITCDKVFTTDKQQIFIAGKFNTTVDFDIDVAPPFGNGPDTVNTFLSSGSFATNTYLVSYSHPGFGLKYAKNLGPNININALEPGKFTGLNFAKYNLHVAGTFSGTVDFDPSTTSTANLTSNGALDAFIAKYDYTGNYIYAKSFGGLLDEVPANIALDADSNIYITGNFLGNNVDFDPNNLSSSVLNSNGAKDVFFAKYSNNADLSFAYNLGAAADDAGITIAAQENRILLGGNFSSNAVDFDFEIPTNTASSNGLSDIFMAEYKLCSGLIDNTMDVQTIYIQSNFNSTNATYRWLDCGNGYSLVPGFTTNIYQPSNVQDLNAGPYAVEITYLGCIDTTYCVNNVTVDLIEKSSSININLFLNSDAKQLTLAISNTNFNVQKISIVNTLGQEVKVLEGKINEEYFTKTYDVSAIENGFYFVRLTGGKSEIYKKVLIFK